MLVCHHSTVKGLLIYSYLFTIWNSIDLIASAWWFYSLTFLVLRYNRTKYLISIIFSYPRGRENIKKIVVTAIQGLIDAADEQLNKRENSMDLNKVSHTHTHTTHIRTVQISELVISKIRKISIEIGPFPHREQWWTTCFTKFTLLKYNRMQPKSMEKYMKTTTPPQQTVTLNWTRCRTMMRNEVPMNSSKLKRMQTARNVTPVLTDLSR